MRGRLFSGLGLLAGLGGFFLSLPAPPQPPVLREAIPRFKRSYQRSNNPRGTVPNRGLKRIQGRQAARG